MIFWILLESSNQLSSNEMNGLINTFIQLKDETIPIKDKKK